MKSRWTDVDLSNIYQKDVMWRKTPPSAKHMSGLQVLPNDLFHQFKLQTFTFQTSANRHKAAVCCKFENVCSGFIKEDIAAPSILHKKCFLRLKRTLWPMVHIQLNSPNNKVLSECDTDWFTVSQTDVSKTQTVCLSFSYPWGENAEKHIWKIQREWWLFTRLWIQSSGHQLFRFAKHLIPMLFKPICNQCTLPDLCSHVMMIWPPRKQMVPSSRFPACDEQ